MNQRSISSILSTHGKLSNKDAWRVAGVLWKDIEKYGVFWEKEGEKKERKKWEDQQGAEILTNERRIKELTKFLDKKLLDGTLQAAELAQFKDIYGLKAKDQDVNLEMIDFKDAMPEEFDVVKAVEEQIRRANAAADSQS